MARAAKSTPSVGTVIKSYDFRSEKDSYIIGRVTGIGKGSLADIMVVTPMIRVVEGKVHPAHPQYFVPVPGTMIFDWPNRVEIL
jgi:hypothetical protein